jgi:hypothetical protein
LPVEGPSATSNEQTNAAQQTVGPEFFDFMIQELAMIIGPRAPHDCP